MQLYEYLNEHPFHKYVYIFNGGVYQKPEGLLTKTVDRVEKDETFFRYVIYLKI